MDARMVGRVLGFGGAGVREGRAGRAPAAATSLSLLTDGAPGFRLNLWPAAAAEAAAAAAEAEVVEEERNI